MDQKIIITDDQGQPREYTCLMNFTDRLTGKSYLLYTDESKDEDGNFKVFFSSYDPEDPKPRLYPVETEEEWDLARALMEQYQDPFPIDFENSMIVD